MKHGVQSLMSVIKCVVNNSADVEKNDKLTTARNKFNEFLKLFLQSVYCAL